MTNWPKKLKKGNEIYLDYKKHKKGNVILDTIFFLVILFAVGLIFIIGHIVQSEVNIMVQNDTDLGPDAKETMQSNTDKYPILFDNGFLTIFILFWIMLLFASWHIDAHPIFFVITLILLIFVIVIGMTFGNSFQDITADADIQPYADDFPILNFIMGNLGIISVVIGFSVAIVMFGKMRGG